MQKFLLGFAFLIASASLGFAQDGPSYSETIEFIEEKVSVNFGESRSNRPSFPSKCVFEYAERQHDSSGRIDGYSIRRAELSDLDPSRVEVGSENSIILHTREGKNLISHSFTAFSFRDNFDHIKKSGEYNCDSTKCVTDTDYERFVTIYTFDGRNNTPRVQKAFSHLVTLCGGRKELF